MKAKIKRGDCMNVLDEIQDGSVDMILTDPPYCSGGMTARDRKKDTRDKYTDTDYNGAARFDNFTGDTMDQRVFMGYQREMIAKAKKKLKPGGIYATFIDWRNLPAMTDAMQIGGGIVAGDSCLG